MDVQRPHGIVAVESVVNRRDARPAAEDGLLLESRNPGMAALLELVERAAADDSTMLLTGESGANAGITASVKRACRGRSYIWRLLKRLFGANERSRHRRNLETALALNREVRRDGLSLKNRLQPA